MRARIGTDLTAATGKPRSSSTAAIGIETFIGNGLPHVSATTDAARVSQLENPLRPRVDRTVHRVAEARNAVACVVQRTRDVARRAAGGD